MFSTTLPHVQNSYLQYSQICARTVRNALKEEARVVATRRDQQGLKFAKWEAGKQGDLVCGQCNGPFDLSASYSQLQSPQEHRF
jgi:F-type H+-transporting ATPase subunit epsilon